MTSALRYRSRQATGVSTCFGTFGELLQGELPGSGGDFLVTFPIAQWAVASFEWQAECHGVHVTPSHKAKSRRIAESVLASVGAPGGGHLLIESELPEGKGLASSSADLVATARAVGNALSTDLPASLLERLLSQIEPTDGVLYPGIVAFDHRAVRLRALLGSLPTMTIIGIDEGGTIDSVLFNEIRQQPSAERRREYVKLLDLMSESVRHGDLATVGRVATCSAVMNQDVCPKPALESVLRIADDVGALGVVAAHSGTMLGIMLDIEEATYAEKFRSTIEACKSAGHELSLYRSLSFK
jgi:uncharacterized protein involved in propanediol utilization